MATPIISARKPWWEKLGDKVKSFSPQVKAGLITGGVGLVGLLVQYLMFSRENSALKHDLKNQEGALAALRHENQVLAVENSRLKIVMDPIERKAREIYPELESSAAIAKLAKDLEDTRNLATRAEFKPLSPQLQDQIVGALKQIGPAYAQDKIALVVGYQTGNIGRAKLAEELSNLLKDGGMIVRFEGGGIYGPESFETPVRVFVNPDGPVAKAYHGVLQSISRLLTSGIVPVGNRSMATNEIVIQILGTPAFLPDGSVLFQ